MASAEEQTELLARRISCILDASMRTAYVRHTLLAMDPAEVADLLSVAHAYTEARSSRHSNLLACLSMALADESCAPLRRAVSALLESRHQHVLARSLRREAIDEEDDALRVPDFGLGRPITLGERKSLARKHDRELITRVLRDPHPDVIRILLGNPALVETDVLLLCARRPVANDVLREVFKSARWIVRYPIKLALVLNPYTPVDVALQLAPLIHDQDVRRILEGADLAPELHAACRQRMDPTAIH
ncbi:MAG TPA: hypothetical protein VHM19_10420 [Polyangiales bacterium]|jgi:hypothetical protein|nr:hypothetical protein [Polyangiales bacterium]